MKTILIVDDSASIRTHLSVILTRAGFKTSEAVDGLDGLAIVNANRNIDLVISDINMPNMCGLEMVEKIKENPENKALPILMLTSEGQMSQVKRAKQAGAVGWIMKPFEPSELVKTVSHLTGFSPEIIGGKRSVATK